MINSIIFYVRESENVFFVAVHGTIHSNKKENDVRIVPKSFDQELRSFIFLKRTIFLNSLSNRSLQYIQNMIFMICKFLDRFEAVLHVISAGLLRCMPPWGWSVWAAICIFIVYYNPDYIVNVLMWSFLSLIILIIHPVFCCTYYSDNYDTQIQLIKNYSEKIILFPFVTIVNFL